MLTMICRFKPVLNTPVQRCISGQTIYQAISARRFSTPAAKMSSVSDVIKTDHRELEQYYEHIVNATSEDEKTRYQNLFVWELARHSVGEELVVYPVFEKQVQGGKALAEEDRKEHQKVKEQLYQFQKMKAGDPNFDPTIKTLMSELKEHIKHEEDNDLPKLEKAISREESKSLAKSFERTKKFVPTKSHPSAPDKPPFETVVGLMAAPIDKLQDLFKKFPRTDSREGVPHQDE